MKRNPSLIHQDLIRQVDGSYMTKSGCKIHVPARFQERGLVTLGTITSIVGIFAVIQGESYGVSTINATFRINPTTTNTVKVDGVNYLEFDFAPGSIVFVENRVLKDTMIVYRIFDELINKGNVPWYLEYNDLLTLFRSADEYAGMDFTSNHSILEMIVASICRSDQDRTMYYRQQLKDTPDAKPVVLPLRNVTYGATNTTSKLMGSYWNDGMTGALVNPSETTERIEDFLRK